MSHDIERLRVQLSALHNAATAITHAATSLQQQVAVLLAGLPAPDEPQRRHSSPPAAHDLPANLND